MTNKEVNKLIGNMKLHHMMSSDTNIPLHAIPLPKFDCSKTNDLTKAILEFCKYSNHYARRISSEGRYRMGTVYKRPNGSFRGPGQFIPGQNKGIADIMMTASGKTIWIEVKVGRDRQSEVQKDFENNIKNSGGEYWIIKTFEQFYSLMKSNDLA